MRRGSGMDRDRDLYGRPARKPERLYLRSQVVDSKSEPGNQLLRRLPMAVDRALRPADADANADANAGADSDSDSGPDSDRIAQDDRIFHSMGHLRP